MTVSAVIEQGSEKHLKAKNMYEEYWAGYDFVNPGRLEQIFELLPPKSDTPVRVLDLGAGDGCFSRYLVGTQRFKQSEITCSDLSERGTQMCRSLGFEGFAWDITTGPTPERFDLVFFLECLEHTFDAAATIRHLGQSLTPGGHLLISTPNHGTLSWKARLLMKGSQYPQQGHMHLLTPPKIKQLFDAAGLTIDAQLFITHLENIRPIVGNVLATVRKWRNPQRYQKNRYNYVKTRFLRHSFGDVMIYRLRRA